MQNDGLLTCIIGYEIMSFDYNKTINTLEESKLYEHHTLENIIEFCSMSPGCCWNGFASANRRANLAWRKVVRAALHRRVERRHGCGREADRALDARHVRDLVWLGEILSM